MKKFFSLLLALVISTQGLAIAATDTTAPELSSLSFPQSINTLSDNRVLPVEITAADESGIKRVQIKLSHPQAKLLKKRKQKASLKAISKRAASSSASSDTFRLNLKIPRKLESGDWNIKVAVFDRAGNKKIYNKEELGKLGLPASVTINSPRDTLPPTVVSLENADKISTLDGDTSLALQLQTKDFSKIQSIKAKFIHENKPKTKKKKSKKQKTISEFETEEIEITQALSTNENNISEFAINVPFPANKDLGIWHLVLKLKDEKGNKATLKDKQFKKLGIKNTIELTDQAIETEDDDSDGTDDGTNGGSDTGTDGSGDGSTGDDSSGGNDGGSGGSSGGGSSGGGSSGGSGGSSGGGSSGGSGGTGGTGGSGGSGGSGGTGGSGGSGGSGGGTTPSSDTDDINDDEPLPKDMPDSMLPAPPSSGTGGSTIDGLDFIFTGSDPIQDVPDPGVFEPTKMAMIRGKVFDVQSQPLTNVTVTVHKHGEYGSTQTLSNGEYNYVVNGGQTYTVNYRKDGFLPIQRTVTVAIRDMMPLEDVCLTQLDSKMTNIDLNSGGLKVAESSMSSDVDGDRHVTIMFPEGTQAEMVMADGSKQPLTSLDVRATEYTVGPNGPMAMPGSLPPSSGYTYAVELSVDQAMSAGAVDVEFSKPLPFYVDNYLNFPVGEAVPAGYYDKEKGAWVASKNGRIIEILSINNGKAELDIDGSGTIADEQTLDDLGIDDAELMKIATMYPAGKSLWRVPIPHFTPWDFNWPAGPPDNADPPPPDPPEPDDDNEPDDPDCREGSIIECETMGLGESIAISGTPFTLEYRSERVKDNRKARTLIIPISNDTVPVSLKAIKVLINIAGRKIKRRFSPNPNQTFEYTWDGLDAFGREVFGSADAEIRVQYEYDLVYYSSRDDFENSFNLPTNEQVGSDARIVGVRDSQTIDLERKYTMQLTNKSLTESLGLGGWSLSSLHRYNPGNKTLFTGDGDVRSADNISQILKFTPGGNRSGFSAPNAESMFVDKNNDIYFTDETFPFDVRKLSADGILSTVVDLGAGFNNFGGKIIGDDEGNIYYIHNRVFLDSRLRKIDPNGNITTILGKDGEIGLSQDGTLATDAAVNLGQGLAISKDGVIHFYDDGRIRKIDPNGRIVTIAGGPFATVIQNAENQPPLKTGFSSVSGMDFGPDGSLYLAQSFSCNVRKISPDGIITTVVNKSNRCGFSGDGGLAVDARLNRPHDLKVANDGTLYIADRNNFRIRKVSPDGFITTFVGDGNSTNQSTEGVPTRSSVSVYALSLTDDGSVYMSGNGKFRRVLPSLPGFNNQEIIISDETGSLYYQFSATGRHLATFNALTNAPIYQFAYDADGYLISITDHDNNVTTIERNGKDISAIVSADGQRTEFTLDSNGYIATITNPVNEIFSMTYTDGGLMTSFTNPRNFQSTFEYFKRGPLKKDLNAAGGSWTLSKTRLKKGFEVQMQTAEGRTIQHKLKRLDNDDLKRIVIKEDGSQNEETQGADEVNTITRADGTVIAKTSNPDPRFGMLSPVISSTTTLPSGLVNTLNTTRTASLSTQSDPLSLTNLTESIDINGRVFSSSFDAANKTFTRTSATNRSLTEIIDDAGRTLQRDVPGLASSFFTYDQRGRPTTITQGTGNNTRTISFSYDSNGYINQIIDPEGDTVDYTRDIIGRVTKQRFSPSREVNYNFDGNDNITGIQPPDKDTHNFSFTPVDLVEEYLPPNVNIGDPSTDYVYDKDKKLTEVKRPDGQNINFNYNNGGQLTSIATPRKTYSYQYDQNSGQLTQLALGTDTVNLSYDGFLQTTEDWDGTIDADVDVTYDNNFFVTSRDVNDANLIGFSYDNDGLLNQAGDLNINLNTQNALIDGTSIDNITTTIGYNEFAEPLTYNAKFNTNDLYDVGYIRDKLGRITRVQETIQGNTKIIDYSYDENKRLSEVKVGGNVVRTYNYDANGNRTQLSGQVNGANSQSQQVSGTYDAQDRLTNYGVNRYDYNINGDLTRKTNTATNAATNYQYDVFGNLITASLPNGTNIEYLVDAKNRRIGKRVNGTLTQGFVYKDQLEPIAELDGNGNVVSRFIYGTKINVPDYMIKGGTKYRIISDNVGSVRLVVDTTTGNVAQRIDYDEFGNVTLDTNPGFQPFGFAGGIYDRDTGLVRFGARDYDPEIGRWTAKDPILFEGQQANLYVYVFNDPINYIDPTGLFFTNNPIFDGAIIGGLSSGIAGAASGAIIGGFIVPGVGAIPGAIAGGIAGFNGGAVQGALNAGNVLGDGFWPNMGRSALGGFSGAAPISNALSDLGQDYFSDGELDGNMTKELSPIQVPDSTESNPLNDPEICDV